MATTSIPLLVGGSGGEPISSSPQRVYNLYPSADSANKAGVVWKETPGWETWKIFNAANLSTMIEFQQALYVIAGTKIYKISNTKILTEIGEMTGLLRNIHMAEDGISLMITTGTRMYRWDGTTFSTVTLPAALTAPTGIIFHDGHFICYQKDSGVFWISDKFDGSTWNSLQFATAEDKPDNIVGLASDRVLWIYGEYTTQAYYNNGALFPFIPNPQGLLIYGMEGDTQAQLDNTSYWLARSKVGTLKVVKANGFAPVAVSTAQLEEELSTLSRIDDAYANTIMWEGHEWYVLTFPSAKRTFVYDTQGVWFEWGEYDSGTDRLVAHPMEDYVFFNGEHLFTDNTGKIQQLQKDVYNHNGSVMVSGFKTNVQHVNEQRIFMNSLIMDMRTGVDDTAVMSLRVSWDGGYTFGNWSTREMGRDGKYRHRVQWHRLGSGFNCVIEGRITDEVPRQIMSGIIDVSTYQSYLERRNDRTGLE